MPLEVPAANLSLFPLEKMRGGRYTEEQKKNVCSKSKK